MEPTRRDILTHSLMLPAAGAWLAGGSPGRWALGGIQDPSRLAHFEGLGFGLFLHYGLYSLIGAGEWAMHLQGIESSKYMERMAEFRAEAFSGRALARAAKRAGMKYITLTSRHHDGFSLYDTGGLSELDITHTPAGRDLIQDFVEGCRAEGIIPMLYHTTLDWTDPRFEGDWKAYQQYLRASIERLCTGYGSIGGFWFDGNWSKPEADWELDALYGLIREHQPDAIIVNNTGLDAGGRIVHPEIDGVTFERGRAEPIPRRAGDKRVVGEVCQTFNFHWGIAESDFNYLSPAHVIEELVACRGVGANLLMNVGPTAAGALPPYESAALARVGDWITMHGGNDGPLYRGRPAGIQGEERDVGLEVDGKTFLFVHELTATANSKHGVQSRGAGERRFEGLPEGVKSARWMDNGEELRLEAREGGHVLHATGYPYGTNTVVRVAEVSS